MRKSGTTEEHGPQFGILAFLSVGGVEKPDASVDTDSKTAIAFGIGLKSLGDRKLGERADLRGGSQFLRAIVGNISVLMKILTFHSPGTPITEVKELK